jgi:hypothetical protein
MAEMVCADGKCGGKMKDGECADCGGTKSKPAAIAGKPAAKKNSLEKWLGKGEE